MALKALWPQGAVIGLAFYQGGLAVVRLGEAFRHNGLAIRCAPDRRAPRDLAGLWDRRRRAQEAVQAELGLGPETPLIGWVAGSTARRACRISCASPPSSTQPRPRPASWRQGGPTPSCLTTPGSCAPLAADLGLGGARRFLGERPDASRLLVALGVCVWLSRGEGMPHVIAEAGGAGLATVATPDNGALQQIVDGESGLFTPYEVPTAAARILWLARDPSLRARVLARCAAEAVAPRWRALFGEARGERPPAASSRLFRGFLQGGGECSFHRFGSVRLGAAARPDRERPS